MAIVQPMEPGQPTIRVGDYVVCRQCGKPSRCTNEGHLRNLMPSDLKALPKETRDTLLAAMMTVAENAMKNN